MTWFHFRLMITGFLFFVADHLLVGQLFTNPKSDRSLLSCLKVTQCSTNKIGDAPLYNSCSLPIQVMTTGLLPAPSKCKSGRFNAWGHSSTHQTTLWRWWSGRPHHATSHLQSQLESQHQSVPECADERDDPLVQSGGQWQTMGVAEGFGAGPQVQRDPGLASEGVLWLCTLLSLAPLLPCRTTLFGHTSRTSPTWPPTTPKLAWSPPSAELPPALVEKACYQFQIRIEAVIEAEGGYIE